MELKISPSVLSMRRGLDKCSCTAHLSFVRGEKVPYQLWTEPGCPKHYTLREEMRRIAREETRKIEAWYKQHATVPSEKRKEI